MNLTPIFRTATLFAAIAGAIAAGVAGAAVKLNTEAQKVGYTLGADIAKDIWASSKTLGQDPNEVIDVNGLILGLYETYQNNGTPVSLSEEEMSEVLQGFMQKQMQAYQEKMNKELRQNLEEGKKFLDDNKTKEGVQVTASGLQYSVKEEGSGKSPAEGDFVRVFYQGRLLNGKVFDSNLGEEKPAELELQYMIPGWVEGLQLMKEGAKYTFFIPSDLAYGEMGAGQDVPPNSTLIFDVELVKVLSAEEAAQAKQAEQAQAESVVQSEVQAQKVEENLAAEGKTAEAKAQESKTDEMKSQEKKSDESKSGEVKTDESKTDETKAEKSNPIGQAVNNAIDDVVSGAIKSN